jgi:hypothetical protein
MQCIFFLVCAQFSFQDLLSRQKLFWSSDCVGHSVSSYFRAESCCCCYFMSIITADIRLSNPYTWFYIDIVTYLSISQLSCQKALHFAVYRLSLIFHSWGIFPRGLYIVYSFPDARGKYRWWCFKTRQRLLNLYQSEFSVDNRSAIFHSMLFNFCIKQNQETNKRSICFRCIIILVVFSRFFNC